MAAEELCGVRCAPVSTPFGVIGVSYRTAPLEIRGRVGFSGAQAQELLVRLKAEGMGEGVVLSTCNRTEIYFAAPDGDLAERLLVQFSGLGAAELGPYLYRKSSVCAACHLFRVVSGLDSAMLGETEIVAQVKQAWNLSRAAGCTGPTLDLLFQRSLEGSKRVRTETDLCRGQTSAGSVAVKEASSRIGGLAGKDVLLVGAGQIAERVGKELMESGVDRLRILNRTAERASQLAARCGGVGAGLEQLEASVLSADVVFVAISAGSPLFGRELLQRVALARGGRGLTIVDLSVPGNVEAGDAIPGVEVLDMDAVIAKCMANSNRRTASVPAALDILDQELERLRKDLQERAASPTIKALVNQTEAIRQRNLDWAMERLPELGEKERKVVEDLTMRIVKGLLQAPIQGLKKDLTGSEHRLVVSKLFGLEDDNHPKP